MTPCFQSGPFDEHRRNTLSSLSENRCKVVSYTSRKQAFQETATNSIILEVQGSPETELRLNLDKPASLSKKITLQDLAETSEIIFTGGFTSESILLHRPVFYEQYQSEFEFTDEQSGGSTDWYYVRVIQTNGSMAWSSPIWVENAK
jgi:dihydrofolate reductase